MSEKEEQINKMEEEVAREETEKAGGKTIATDQTKVITQMANNYETGEERKPEDLAPFLRTLAQNYEEVVLPSRGCFYEGKFPEGKIHVKPMTMKEEKLLATQRLIRTGKAIDMIFESCMQETFPAEELLSIDRTFLLIWLRGISYGSEYDVNVKCPNCNNSFPETINLSELPVDFADEGASEPKGSVFPRCGHPFKYRFSRGKDEAALARHRERKARAYGDDAIDDTLVARDSMLIVEIGGFTNKQEISVILESLSMEDATHLRSLFREPGFGVKTLLPLICPFCSSDFDVDLPMDANFFFPQRMRKPS